MNTDTFMRPLNQPGQKKKNVTKDARYSTETTEKQTLGLESRRSRTKSSLAANISSQNRYTLGVGVRRMSVVVDRQNPYREVTVFQRAVKSVISLLKLVALLRSHDKQLVKISLMKIMNLVQAPQNAGIMNDVGVCSALIDLLNLDPLSHWQIVGMALHGIDLLVLSPECSLNIANHPNFTATLEKYLRSDSVMTQRLTASIVSRCFVQPIISESDILDKNAMVHILLKSMSLPFANVKLTVLRLLEDLTYHCPNTAKLCHGIGTMESNFFQDLIELITEEADGGEERYRVLMLIRNIMYATEVEPVIVQYFIHFAPEIELALVKCLRAINSYSTRHSLLFSNVLKPPQMRDISPTSGEEVPRTAKRRSSHSARRYSVKYTQPSPGDDILNSSPASSASSQALAIRKMEESDAIIEILWLFHTSHIFQRVLKSKKAKVPPDERICNFATSVLK
mmetsp:Transcript_20926/g.30155  ORF Transcript_20926/g.30155 Transcript_20926/m.30155 type:complete len:453 (-) Transcript_20926:76-1434(-)